MTPTSETKPPATDADFDIRAENLAGQIIRNATTSILLNLRFLESALFRLHPAPAKTTLATNGEQLYYGFEYLFRTYKRESTFLTRGILHTLMHCIFRHPFVSGAVNSQLWNLASDIAAEAAIEDLGIPTLATHRSVQQADILRQLKQHVPNLTAEKLYRHFCYCPMEPQEYEELANLFHVCDHELWYAADEEDENAADKGTSGSDKDHSASERRRDHNRRDDQYEDANDEPVEGSDANSSEEANSQEESSEGDESSDTSSDGKSEDSGDKSSEDEGEGSGDASDEAESEDSGNTSGQGEGKDEESSATSTSSETEGSGSGGSFGDTSSPSQRPPAPINPSKLPQLEEMWEDISRHVEMDMSTFSMQAGIGAGSLMQQLQDLNREKYDYRTFLKRFATRHEELKVNDDEFDYIFYTYGLKLYEKMPLIEPLEYKEEQRIRDFVIVIDTSGSTSGPLVQTFLQKTYNILMSTETFSSRVNLYIIQCDYTIQEVTKITSSKDFEAYMKNMKILGLGGTDFRPPFHYVDELIKSGELTKLKGLIYFTDGYGIFPSQKPDYDAAFVFLRNEYDEPAVPPWAIKLVLEDEEVVNI